MKKLYCERCGSLLPKKDIVCEKCGYFNEKLVPVFKNELNKKDNLKIVITTAVLLVLMFIAIFLIGKMASHDAPYMYFR